MNEAAERRLLGLVGLGIRARNAVVGVEQVRMAARKGKLALALVAPDASPNSQKKLLPLLKATAVTVVQGPGATALGSVAGRESASAIGITDAALARGIRKLLEDEARAATVAPAAKGFRRTG